MNPANGIDILLVLGAGKVESIRRAKHASELAKTGDFPIILSGYTSNGNSKSEAEYMRDVLASEGVVPERMFIDNIAKNTLQNIAYSRTIVEARNARRVGICTGRAHMSRAYRLARRILPKCTIVRCPAPLRGMKDLFTELATFPIEVYSSLRTFAGVNNYQEQHGILTGYLGEKMPYNRGHI